MRSIALALSALLFTAMNVMAAPPPAEPVHTEPTCKWSKKYAWPRKWDGVWICRSEQIIHVKNTNTFSCGMIVYRPDIRIIRFDFAVFPKKPGGDRFGMYAIKSSVDNSTGINAPQISADVQNLVNDAAGPRPVNADYVCRTYMEIRP